VARIEQALKEAASGIEEYEFKKAVDSIMSLADYGNIYFQSREPWKLVKIDKERAGAVLKNCLQIAKALVVLMQPVMPSKMEEAWRQFGLEGSADGKTFEEALVPLRTGQPLGKPEILFSRLEEAAVKDLDRIFMERIREAESKERVRSVEKKEMISFDEFQSLDLRVGEIKEAGRIKGSDKLLKLSVDIGGETRQVVAGIAQAYKSEDLVGLQVVVLANLEPAKLFGIESQAMLLAADVSGKAVLLRPTERVETGTKVR
jgi:methionyl-tRNA synthetase